MLIQSERLAAAELDRSSDVIPSRESNPFATCWTRPSAIPFRFPEGQNAESLIAKLAKQAWRGAIVGPHGSGKSALLATLRPCFCHADRPVCVIDGYERLGIFARLYVQARCRTQGHGLVVTSHGPTSLPTLIELSPSLPLVQDLVSNLGGQSFSASEVAASFARNSGNIRDVFFDLYEQFEQLRRPTANGSAGHNVTKVIVTAS